jgi:1-acyl-sn-glycerol-3-phosphate acyltransferase
MNEQGSGRPPPVDTSWAQSATARFVRRFIHGLVLEPILEVYTHPTVVGRENLAGLDEPVIFAANHSSHIDTPILLRALPVRWRERTVVAAAADYFFRKKPIAWSVALVFGAVPIERQVRTRDAAESLIDLVQSDWNILVYPEGTRSRDGSMGPLRTGVARLALEHDIPIVPIYVSGTHEAMPPGRWWPRHHKATVAFGPPLTPLAGEDHKALTARLTDALGKLRSSLTEGA